MANNEKEEKLVYEKPIVVDLDASWTRGYEEECSIGSQYVYPN